MIAIKTMDDLISRQAAINECYPIVIEGEKFDVVQVETLMGLPTADVVEVVRCKDCKHRVHDGSRDLFYCELMFYGLGSVEDENFCSYGAR